MSGPRPGPTAWPSVRYRRRLGPERELPPAGGDGRCDSRSVCCSCDVVRDTAVCCNISVWSVHRGLCRQSEVSAVRVAPDAVLWNWRDVTRLSPVRGGCVLLWDLYRHLRAAPRRDDWGERGPFEFDSFHVTSIDIMLNAEKIAGDRSPRPSRCRRLCRHLSSLCFVLCVSATPR